MDVLVPKVGEIIGGSQREERHDLLAGRMRDIGIKNLESYEWYLDIRKYGSVPHAGFGLGFERALMYITGMANIRDVLPFPRVPRWAKF
jgi:asparaginyl-tRNA synthetase